MPSPHLVDPHVRADCAALPIEPPSPYLGAWERKIKDPWCTQLFCGSGLKIPTSDGTYIPPWTGDNYPSATVENFTEIDNQVTQLLTSGRIERVTLPSDVASLIVNPVGAANKKDRGIILPEKRFYLDCSRHTNSRLPHYKMRLPGYDDALERLFPNAWLAKVDLSAAFLHVRIHKDDRRVLGFKWGEHYYRFTRMIFGLSTAPAVWQYAMDRVCDYLNSIGLNICVYLDDFLLIADTRSTCEQQLATLYDELASLGLTVNKKKTLGPSQSIHYLGLEIDSVKMELRVPDYKLRQVCEQIAAFRNLYQAANSAPLRAVLSLTGRLGHISRAVRASRPFLRRLWDLCRGFDFGHHLRNRPVYLNKSIWHDLEWWEALLAHWNGVARWISEPDIVSFSDASNAGFGYHSGSRSRHGSWPIPLRGRHINWKELYAIELSCAEFGPSWARHRILLACDNQTAVSIINAASSRNPSLAAIARRIALLAAIYDFDFRAVHIPGASNHFADFLSRTALPHPHPEWHSSRYLELLDAPPSVVLHSLATFHSELAASTDAILSSCDSSSSTSRKTCRQYEEDLRSLRQTVPDLEHLARSLRSPDPFGHVGRVFPSVPGPHGDNRLCTSVDQGRALCTHLSLQVPFVDHHPSLQRHNARYCAHHCRTPEAETPIPLEVVTPTRQTYSSCAGRADRR